MTGQSTIPAALVTGAIMIISSINGIRGFGLFAAYAAKFVTGAGYIVMGGFTTGIPAGVAPPVQHN